MVPLSLLPVDVLGSDKLLCYYGIIYDVNDGDLLIFIRSRYTPTGYLDLRVVFLSNEATRETNFSYNSLSNLAV